MLPVWEKNLQLLSKKYFCLKLKVLNGLWRKFYVSLPWKGDYDIVLPTKRFSLPNNMFILNMGRSFSIPAQTNFKQEAN